MSEPLTLLTCSNPPDCTEVQAVEFETVALQMFDATAIGVTPENILYVFSWGFGAVLLSWSIGYAVGIAVKVIRSA